MEIIDNLIYTVLNSTKTPAGAVGDFLAPVDFDYLEVNGSMGTGVNSLPIAVPNDPGNFSYGPSIRNNFIHVEDTSVIEKGIQKHWFDVGNRFNYTSNPADANNIIFTNLQIPPYHLIYAYLIENTRIAQIFEKVISMALHDEAFGMPDIPSSSPNVNALQWLVNTENLFYKDLPAASYRNISSQLRVFPEATRRNAYFRMFGMDLAFGDYKNEKIDYPYLKASSFNSGFVLLFEQFLAEVWQAYTNAKNTSGANTTDFEHIKELGIQLHDMLMSRRSSSSDFKNYKYFTLSKEEYASVIMMSWLMYAISDTENSPIVKFLKCEANSADERLLKIGLKVGLPAHSKSKSLMEMAAPLAALLRSIENGVYEDTVNIQGIITSQSGVNWSGNPAAVTGRNLVADSRNLDDLLTIMNNWEKATGHKIKNPGANITGTVRVAPQQQLTNGNLLVPNLS